MAAPSEAYHDKSLTIRSSGSLVETNQMAKLLSAYGGISGAKALFKLDYVHKEVKESTGEVFFTGMVSTSGSNAAYHKSTRIGSYGFSTYKLLLDAGLNTLPEASVGSMTNEAKWENWINIPVTITPAYYIASTTYGYSYKINNGSWSDVSVATFSTGSTLTTKIVQVDLSSSLSEGDTLYLRAYAVNDEGTMYSSETSFTVLEAISVVAGNFIHETDPQASLGSAVNIYMTEDDEGDIASVTTTDTSTGIYTYASEYFNSGNYMDNGYYLLSGYSNKSYLITSGEIRKYVVRTSYASEMNLYVLNKAADGLPEYYIIANAINGTFPNTVNISTSTAFFSLSGGVYTEVGTPFSSTLQLTQGDANAEVFRATLNPPSGATHSRTTTSTSGIGLTVNSPYQLL